MRVKYRATRWALTTSVRLAWAMPRVAERLGNAGVRLEDRLDAVAVAWSIDMVDVIAPLTERPQNAGEA